MSAIKAIVLVCNQGICPKRYLGEQRQRAQAVRDDAARIGWMFRADDKIDGINMDLCPEHAQHFADEHLKKNMFDASEIGK